MNNDKKLLKAAMKPKPLSDKPMKEWELMDFGKYKGEKLGDVPAKYLVWCYEEAFIKRSKPRLYAYIVKNIQRIKRESEEEEEEENDYDTEIY